MRRVIERLDRLLAALELALLVATLGGAAAISFALIAMRNLAGVSYNSLEQIAVYLALWMVFIGSAAADRAGISIRIDILMHALPSRQAARLQRVADGLTAILAGSLAWYSLDAVLFSYRINERAVSTLDVKIWILMTVMPAAFLLIALRAALRTAAPRTGDVVLVSAH